MEQAHHLLDLIHSYFPHESADIRTISPLKLAYLGDAVYEIIIRTLIMERTGGPVKNLHKRTSEFVNAGSQAKLICVCRTIYLMKKSAFTVTGATRKRLLWQSTQTFMITATLPV